MHLSFLNIIRIFNLPGLKEIKTQTQFQASTMLDLKAAIQKNLAG
jgi:hypothetical protein